MIWAHNWHDSQVVGDQNAILRDKEKLKHVRGKAVVCAILGASLGAAQEELLASQKKESETMQAARFGKIFASIEERVLPGYHRT